MIKVLIATVCPSLAEVKRETLDAVRSLDVKGLVVDWFIGTEQLDDAEAVTGNPWTVGRTIAHNLNKALSLAKWEDYNYLWVLESDIVPAPDSLKLMLKDAVYSPAHIVSALVPERPLKVASNIVQFLYYPKRDGTGHHDPTYQGLDNLKHLCLRGEPFTVKPKMRCNVGRCCLLITEELFKYKFVESDGVWIDKIRELGFTVVVDPRVKCLHVDRDGTLISPWLGETVTYRSNTGEIIE